MDVFKRRDNDANDVKITVMPSIVEGKACFRVEGFIDYEELKKVVEILKPKKVITW